MFDHEILFFKGQEEKEHIQNEQAEKEAIRDRRVFNYGDDCFYLYLNASSKISKMNVYIESTMYR